MRDGSLLRLGQPPTLRVYAHVVGRRKWAVLVAVILAPAAAFLLSSRQPARYQSSAQVLLGQQPTSPVSSAAAQASFIPASPQTQAALARVPAVAALAVSAFRLRMAPEALLAATSVSISPDGGILVFSATASEPTLAGRMATAYARAYMQYRLASETFGLRAAIKGLQARLAQPLDRPVRNSLLQQIQTLEETAVLRTADTKLIRAGEPGARLAAHTTRNTALGLVLGLFLGIGLAFLLEAFDSRVRSADAIGGQLELPLLARLPAPPRRLRRENRLAMLTEPYGDQAEAFRMLRANLEFASLRSEIRTLMVTSAVADEGKSTTVANLAVAYARAGRNVILVDLDLRRPFLHRFFDLDDQPGLTEVALGHVSLEQALAAVPLGLPLPPTRIFSRNGHDGLGRGVQPVRPFNEGGELQVLTAGPTPPDPGEFIESGQLAEILHAVRSRADLVLLDASPLLQVGDSVALSAKVDALVLVTRMEVLRRPALAEVKRLLAAIPSARLGFVVTDSRADEGYAYAGYQYLAHPAASQERARV